MISRSMRAGTSTRDHLHRAERVSKPCQRQLHTVRVLLEQHLQRCPGHILNHCDVRRVVALALVSQMNSRGAEDPKGVQAPVSGLEKVHA